MALMYVLCFAFVLLVAVLVITQVIIPIVQGRKTFPLFRGSHMKLEGEISELRSQEEENRLRQQRDTLAARIRPLPPTTHGGKQVAIDPGSAMPSGIRPNASTSFSSGRTASDDASVMNGLAMGSAFGSVSPAAAFSSSSIAPEVAASCSSASDSSSASCAAAPASTD